VSTSYTGRDKEDPVKSKGIKEVHVKCEVSMWIWGHLIDGTQALDGKVVLIQTIATKIQHYLLSGVLAVLVCMPLLRRD